MARDVTANFTTTPQLVPNGVQYTQYRVSVHLSNDDSIVHQAMVAFTETKADFAAVMPGLYYARVELSNEDGSSVALGVDSEDFEVPDDDATLEVPLGVTVTVHPMT